MTAYFTDFDEVIERGEYPIAGDAMTVRQRTEKGSLWERVAESKPTRVVPLPTSSLPKTMLDRLHIDPNDPDYRLAKENARQDYNLHFDLIRARKTSGLTAADIAERTGMSIEEVREFESYDSDPTLSQARRYAQAINVVIRHSVSAA